MQSPRTSPSKKRPSASSGGIVTRIAAGEKAYAYDVGNKTFDVRSTSLPGNAHFVVATGFFVGHKLSTPTGGKARKRRLSGKKKAVALFRLWHSIQDIKAKAEEINDDELVLLTAMVELLVEERTAGRSEAHGAVLSPSQDNPAGVASDAYQPDARARALLQGVKLVEEDLSSSGGAYSLTEVQALMRGITRQAINNRVREGSLLAVPGPSNRATYPAVQFMNDGMPVDGLKEVRDALGTVNSWMVLNFLVSPEPKLSGRKPIDLLKAGKLKQVLEVARRFGLQGA